MVIFKLLLVNWVNCKENPKTVGAFQAIFLGQFAAKFISIPSQACL